MNITYDSLSSVIQAKVVFTVSAKPVGFPTIYTIAWTIDTFHFSRVGLDTVGFFFRDSGTHGVKAVYIDSTGSKRDSASTLISIKDTTHKLLNPGDTTSHNFTWHEYSISTESTLNNVWVFGPNDIWTSGTYMYHLDGVSWNQIQSAGLGGGTMFGLPDGTIWMGNGGIIEHFYPISKGADRFRSSDFGGGFITSSWGTSSHNMFFAGKSGLILHFDGTNWLRDSTPTTKDLYSIWGTADNNIWADGFNSQTAESVLLHYDGTVWSEINLHSIGNIGPGVDGMGGVWATDSAGHRLVYTGGSHVWHQKDNDTWSSDSGQVTNGVGGGQYIGVFGIHGNTANDIMVTGSNGFFFHTGTERPGTGMIRFIVLLNRDTGRRALR